MHRHLFTALFFASTLIVATAEAQDGPKNAAVLIVRHAEDADSGHGLPSRGQDLPEAYKNSFRNFTADSKGREHNDIL